MARTEMDFGFFGFGFGPIGCCMNRKQRVPIEMYSACPPARVHLRLVLRDPHSRAPCGATADGARRVALRCESPADQLRAKKEGAEYAPPPSFSPPKPATPAEPPAAELNLAAPKAAPARSSASSPEVSPTPPPPPPRKPSWSRADAPAAAPPPSTAKASAFPPPPPPSARGAPSAAAATPPAAATAAAATPPLLDGDGGGVVRTSFAAGGERKRLIAPRGKSGPTRMKSATSGAPPTVAGAGLGSSSRPKVLRSPGSSFSKADGTPGSPAEVS